ncbi:hypothetical protein [Shimia sp. R9_3]|uniref:hypothetical protein n=1 Tax=Shimia sp. R9_3 TaxID=2821113 RepID=UPI001ADAF01F|nr:hypothetical protein [Shimia sp. R9_3]MBO9403123.1 hypothetical protein [Shimia sp. R9_3]
MPHIKRKKIGSIYHQTVEPTFLEKLWEKVCEFLAFVFGVGVIIAVIALLGSG